MSLRLLFFSGLNDFYVFFFFLNNSRLLRQLRDEAQNCVPASNTNIEGARDVSSPRGGTGEVFFSTDHVLNRIQERKKKSFGEMNTPFKRLPFEMEFHLKKKKHFAGPKGAGRCESCITSTQQTRSCTTPTKLKRRKTTSSNVSSDCRWKQLRVLQSHCQSQTTP